VGVPVGRHDPSPGRAGAISGVIGFGSADTGDGGTVGDDTEGPMEGSVTGAGEAKPTAGSAVSAGPPFWGDLR